MMSPIVILITTGWRNKEFFCSVVGKFEYQRNLTIESDTLNRLKVVVRLLTTDLEVSDERESTSMIFTEIVDNNQQSSA